MSENSRVPQPQHLAWHETLELHEVVATLAHQLIAFKMQHANIQDPTLRSLYTEAIRGLEKDMHDLLPYYEKVPIPTMRRDSREPDHPTPTGVDMTAFYAGNLLVFFKTATRNYAAVITETATPSLHEMFQRHLLNAVNMHYKVFNFMLERNYYPAYHLDRLLAGDLRNAKAALSM
ncbi:spore coat protein [Paenibacillus sp. GP183]|uniref:spore coat protein n=1 Tax=Paenibacillus sp. GP183 TaxID=1882751 RepID=UPI0008999E0A|nr:spore coat protein [Paenibacillus sp. GP183]SEC60886.1 spore coat protein F [Paenibacillus sp. GP183]